MPRSAPKQRSFRFSDSASSTKPQFDNLLIRASAGTGKTFQLANRYLSLLARGVPPERILATTFTRKAAAEILDRVIMRLGAAALDDTQRRELGNLLGLATFTREDCLRLLQSLLRNLHRLRIGTLDSLFGQLARAFSFEMALPPGWRIVDDAEEIQVREASIEALLHQENTDQLLALTHLLTKGEAIRGVGDLIRDTVTKLHGLFQETSQEAWHAIKRHKPLDPAELAALLDELRQLPMPERRFETARDGDYERAASGDWEGFLEKGLAAKVLAGETSYHSKPISDDAIRIYSRLLDQARAVLVNRVVLQTEGSFKLLEGYDAQRRRWQEEHRGLRFDDVARALDLALSPPTKAKEKKSAAGTGNGQLAVSEPGFAHRLDGAVSHLLLDEFQDTSPRQWRALRPFVQRSTSDDGNSSFFCVGDVKQAIYGWRGGVAEIFDAIEREVPGLKTRPLTHSYRSSRAVIEFVNQVFTHACVHPRLERAADSVKFWCERFQEHSTERTSWPGHVTLRTAMPPSEEQETNQNVLQTAAELIAELHSQSPSQEIGVLVRTNTSVGRLITLLHERNLPASEEGGNPLTDSAAVQIVLSCLLMADHPGDTVARFHVATSPLGTALGFTAYDDDIAARDLAAETRCDLQSRGFGPVVQRWVTLLTDSCNARDRGRLTQLVEQAYAYQSRATIRAADFVRHIQCARVAEPTQAPIRVMTIHQSKGLEFDIVVLPELDVDLTGQPPPFVVERLDPVAPVTRVCRYVNANVQKLMSRRIQDMFQAAVDREVSESLCVLYVALTRAIHALHIVISPSKAKENSFPRTLAGLVRAAVVGDAPAPPQSILFQAGNPHWYRSLPVADVEQPAAKPSEDRIVTLAPAEQRQRGLERISPSRLEGGTKVRIGRWLDLDAQGTTLRGTVLHACFEQIRWLDEGLPNDEQLRASIAEVLRKEGQPGDPHAFLKEFHQLVSNPIIASQLRRDTYKHPETLFPAAVAKLIHKARLQLQVETERAFAVREDGGLLAGNIDRLVLLRDEQRIIAADVVDFKTDAMSGDVDAAVRERVEFYRPQLNAYRRAVAKMTGLNGEAVSARLLFVSAARVEIVQ